MEIDGRHCETEESQIRRANRFASRRLLARLKEVHGKPTHEPEPDIQDIVPVVVRRTEVAETKAEARFIRYLTDEQGRRIPTIHEIKHVVAEHFKITTTNIDSKSRAVKFCLPRQIGYYLSRELTVRSLPDIARRFGGRDHTSALSGIKKIERLLQNDMQLAKTVSRLREQLQ
jgi:chromosomal replication initiation ATPase DnaA